MRPYFKRYRPSKRSSTSRQTRRQRLSSSHQQKTQSTSGSQTKTTDPYVDLLNLFGSWSKVGSQYTQQIPPGKPLPDNELKACTDRGITFIQALGSGGFGTVWKCSLSQPLSDRTGKTDYTQYEMAVKILSVDRFKRNRTPYQAVQHMMEEYDLHSKLNHENIVRSEEAFHVMDQTTQFPYVRHLHFMELCTDSLRSIIKRKTLNEFHAKQWFRQVSMGLQYLHHMGIAHMDIKTANILFIYDSSTGTHAFAAPELARASMGAPVDTFRCDIYSLGLTICETLAGKNQHRYAMIAIKKVTIPNQLGQLTNKNASPRLTISTYPFVHMINWMLDDNPIHRPTIDELINCQWFQT